jgi:hypothetical protein
VSEKGERNKQRKTRKEQKKGREKNFQFALGSVFESKTGIAPTQRRNFRDSC